MAKCDQGYLCEVCGQPVENITDSDLYLRYVLGEIPYAQLHRAPERHLRCNPVDAQFIVDPDFTPVEVTGLFDKRLFDPVEVAKKEDLYSRAWRRLRQVAAESLPLSEYPLPEFRQPE